MLSHSISFSKEPPGAGQGRPPIMVKYPVTLDEAETGDPSEGRRTCPEDRQHGRDQHQETRVHQTPPRAEGADRMPAVRILHRRLRGAQPDPLGVRHPQRKDLLRQPARQGRNRSAGRPAGKRGQPEPRVRRRHVQVHRLRELRGRVPRPDPPGGLLGGHEGLDRRERRRTPLRSQGNGRQGRRVPQPLRRAPLQEGRLVARGGREARPRRRHLLRRMHRILQDAEHRPGRSHRALQGRRQDELPRREGVVLLLAPAEDRYQDRVPGLRRDRCREGRRNRRKGHGHDLLRMLQDRLHRLRQVLRQGRTERLPLLPVRRAADQRPSSS